MVGEGANKRFERGFTLGWGGVGRQTNDAAGGVAIHAPREKVASIVG